MPIIEHQPPERNEISPNEQILFLAGPIQGAQNWQLESVNHFTHSYLSDATLHIANPRRDTVGDEFNYKQQVRWERDHLFDAAKFGAVMFWFANQDLSLPYQKGRAYAQTTRIEFGITYCLLRIGEQPNVVMGMEPGYKGNEKYYLDVADELGLPVYSTLEDAWSKTLEKIIINEARAK